MADSSAAAASHAHVRKKATAGTAARVPRPTRALASGNASGATGTTLSPRRRSGSRLVARTFSLGARSRACSASGAAATQPLDVVNKQEHLAGTEEGEQAVINRLARQGRDAKLLGHRLADQGDVGQRLERDERGAVRELVGGGMRGREGEGSLADTTRPGTQRRKQSAS
jgi:hypothetical protein